MAEKINEKYYKGFEGEREIRFIRISSNGDKYILSIWDGYFNAIMYSLKPQDGKWTGLAYCFHLDEGWEAQISPWEIPNLDDAINQLSEAGYKDDEEADYKNVLDGVPDLLKDILDFLISARSTNESVYIEDC